MISYEKFAIHDWISACTKYQLHRCYRTPERACSWRGVYAEPALVLGRNEGLFRDWLPFLNDLTKSKFYGYKGGEYFYNQYDGLNIESHYADYSEIDEQSERFKTIFFEDEWSADISDRMFMLDFYKELLSSQCR